MSWLFKASEEQSSFPFAEEENEDLPTLKKAPQVQIVFYNPKELTLHVEISGREYTYVNVEPRSVFKIKHFIRVGANKKALDVLKSPTHELIS